MKNITFSKFKDDPYTYQQTEKIRYLEPINLGSSNIESLSSYITRLAHSHYLRTRIFIFYLLKDIDHYSYSTTVSGSPRLWYSVNGINQRALDMSSILNANFDNDFRTLTFLTIAQSIERRAHGLLDQTMTWCYECWKERLDNNLSIYIPLSWTSKFYTICTKHMCKLTYNCPHCNGTQNQIPFIPSLLHCQHCGYELICKKKPETVCPIEFAQEIWFSKNIENLIQKTSNNNYFINSPPIPEFLRAIITKHWNNDIGNFSIRIGFKNREAVSHWMSGRKQPSFYNIIRMSYLLQIPIFDILNSTVSPLFIDKSIIDYKPVKDGRYKRLRTNEEIENITKIVLCTLSDMRKGKNFISVTQLSNQLDCNIWLLRNRFENEYFEIKRLYSEFAHMRKERDNQHIITTVSNACCDLLKNHIYPTERRLKENYNLPVRYVRRLSAKKVIKKFQAEYQDGN